MKTKTLSQIREVGLLAVLRAPSADTAVKISEALVAGGVTGIEITFTTPNALQAVKTLSEKYGDQIVLGVGTITQPEQAADSLAAGARFLVSPHTETKLARAMVQTGLPCMMGALTPSEVMMAYQLGADVVKLFPGSLGGPGYLKSLHGPFPDIPLMPTGGVSLENLEQWFAVGAYAVGVGSALFPKEWVAAERFDDIRDQAKQYRAEIERIRQAH